MEFNGAWENIDTQFMIELSRKKWLKMINELALCQMSTIHNIAREVICNAYAKTNYTQTKFIERPQCSVYC